MDSFATPAAIAATLRASLDRHDISHDACAAYLGVSRQLVTRWCNPDDELTIDARRVMALPPVVRRDMIIWQADMLNCVLVERIMADDEGSETHGELTLDLVAAASRATAHSASIRRVMGVDDAAIGSELCDEVERAAGRLRLRYRHALEQRGAMVRPGLRKSRPPVMDDIEAEVA